MTKTGILRLVFENRLMQAFIPAVNAIVTYAKYRAKVKTEFDKKNKRWVHIENGKAIYVDKRPLWKARYGMLEEIVLNVCCKKYFPQKDDVIVDVGAGVGSETIVFSRLVGANGKVFAIEAHPETAFSLELLIKNSDGMNNVHISPVAIGGSRGFSYINDMENHVRNSLSVSERGLKVPVVTLDDYVSDNQISTINFLKINVEGSEEEMIFGMEKTMTIVKNIAVSCHDFLEPSPTNRIKNKIEYLLDSYGFLVEGSSDEHPILSSWVYGKKESALK